MAIYNANIPYAIIPAIITKLGITRGNDMMTSHALRSWNAIKNDRVASAPLCYVDSLGRHAVVLAGRPPTAEFFLRMRGGDIICACVHVGKIRLARETRARRSFDHW